MAGQTTSSKALIYLSERVEDAAEAVKGLIGGSGSSKYLDTLDDRTSVTRSQLESDRDDLRLEGLRTIIAMLSKGRDASIHFPQVLKLTSNSNLEIRKLVYIIVRRYAKRQPDVALLGINSFQRDLLDRSEVVRSMALRVLSGLQLPLVASVVEVAIAKCVKDPHFYVRKGAALAIVKCFQLSSDTRSALKNHLTTLLNDRHPAVLSAALVAYSAISPFDFELLHPHYRKLCHALSDMDEWGQRNAIGVLGLYARKCIAKPVESSALDSDLELLFAKVEDLLMSRNPAVVTAAIRLLYTLAPTSYHSTIARPLLRLTKSTPDVAYFALINCYLLCQVSPSLLSPHLAAFLLRSSLIEPSHLGSLKLKILVQLSDSSTWETVKSELSEQAQFNNSRDVSKTAVEQLGVLAAKEKISSPACVKELLRLLKECNDRDEVVASAVGVLRRLLQSGDGPPKAVIVTRLASLLFTPPPRKELAKKTKLVGKGSVKSGLARSSIYWLLGQYCRVEVQVKKKGQADEDPFRSLTLAQVIGADILRRAASNFAKEESVAKLQIIVLSTKLNIFLPTVEFENIKALKLIHAYILQLARYDEDFDVRDRGRFCKALTDRVDAHGKTEGDAIEKQETDEGGQLGGVVLRRDQVLHILFEGKPVTSFDEDNKAKERKDDRLDALAYVLKGSRFILDKESDFTSIPWAELEDLPPVSVRDPALPTSQDLSSKPSLLSISSQRSFSSDKPITGQKVEASNSSASSPGLSVPNASNKYKDLDAFLDEESEEEEEDDDTPEDGDDEEEVENDDDDDEIDQDEATDSSGGESIEIDSQDETDEENEAKEEVAHLIPTPIEENEWARQ